MPSFNQAGSPRISVVVVNLDGLEFLGPLFESLKAQTLSPDQFEIIFVDNGSTDGSVDFVRATCPEARVIRNDRNYGFARPNNQAAEVSSARFLALVNNDMRLAPDWLERMVTALETGPDDLACVGSRILSWDGSTIDFAGSAMTFYGIGHQSDTNQPVKHTSSQEVSADLLFACGGAMMIRKDVFLEVGGFDEAFFAYFEDVDLGWRLWVLGYRVAFCHEAIAFHRHNGTSGRFPLASKLALIERNALAMTFKNYEDGALERILPAALLLTARRAGVRSRVDHGRFRFPGAEPASERPPSAATLSSPVQLEPVLVRLGNLIKKHGPAEAAKVLAAKAAMRFLDRLGPSCAIADLPVKPEGYAGLVALSDFIEMLPSLIDKRRFVQARRMRPDAEVIPLFKTPFLNYVAGDDLPHAQQVVTDAFGIDRLFSNSQNSPAGSTP